MATYEKYIKQTWTDEETPLDADHMNHIEDGIKSISDWIEAGGNANKLFKQFISGSLIDITADMLDEVDKIGDYAFYHKNIERIIIPDSVTQIGSRAFGSCQALKEVDLPDNGKNISVSAFEQKQNGENFPTISTTSIIQSDLWKVGRFYNGQFTPFNAVFNGDISGREYPLLIYVNGEGQWDRGGMYVVDQGIGGALVPYQMILGNVTACSTAVQYTVPEDAVISIGLHVSAYLAGQAFVVAKNNTIIYPKSSVEKLFTGSYVSGNWFTTTASTMTQDVAITNISVNKGDKITFAASKGSASSTSTPLGFGLYGLNMKIFSNQKAWLASIDEGVFGWCSTLQNITIPDGVVYIGYQAFADCYALAGNITIPSSVMAAGSSIFQNDRSIDSVVFAGQPVISSGMFYKTTAITMYDFRNAIFVPTLPYTSAIGYKNTGCKIVVPDNLYDTWIKATNWAALTNITWVKASEYVEE